MAKPTRMSGERFLTVTPVCLITSGSSGTARATRFCTSTWAMFTFIPFWNVTVRLYDPSLVQLEDI